MVADGVLGTETFLHEARGPCTTGSGLGREEEVEEVPPAQGLVSNVLSVAWRKPFTIGGR